MAKGYSHIGIFRLAPQDYHRFHSPVNAVVGKTKDIIGNLYTVNPMAVKEYLA
jgi:phosphatidylserine decarboxylase